MSLEVFYDFLGNFVLFGEIRDDKLRVFCKLGIHFVDSGAEDEGRYELIDLRKDPVLDERVLKDELEKSCFDCYVHLLYAHVDNFLP